MEYPPDRFWQDVPNAGEWQQRDSSLWEEAVDNAEPDLPPATHKRTGANLNATGMSHLFFGMVPTYLYDLTSKVFKYDKVALFKGSHIFVDHGDPFGIIHLTKIYILFK